MVSKGMVSKSKYTRFLKKISACQYPFVPIFKGIFQSLYSHFQIIYCKGMVSKSKYWISENIRVGQYLFARIFRCIFQSQYSHFQIIYCKGIVSKSKYWISENNKGDEYSKTPKNPLILSTGFVSGALTNHNACSL